MKIVEYLDLTHPYYILCPKTEEAEDLMCRGEYVHLQDYDQYYDYIKFNEKTFCFLEDRLLSFINIKCDAFISMYEEDVLDSEQLDIAIEITEEKIKTSGELEFIEIANKILDLMKLAKKRKLLLGFYF